MRRYQIKQQSPANKPDCSKPVASPNPKLYKISLPISVPLFIAQNFWGASMLANLSQRWGYILFLFSNGIILGWWTWLLVSWIYRRRCFANRIRLASALVVFLAFAFTTQYYVDLFIKPQGTIVIPPYTPDSTQVIVRYGNKNTGTVPQMGDAITTIGELKQKPWVSFKINEQEIFKIHINAQREVSVDTTLFTGFYDQSRHIFSPPVIIKDNAPNYLPYGWKKSQNSTNYEIYNQNGIPVLLMEYKDPYTVIVSGLFATTWGVCKVDNNKTTLYLLGDTLSELNPYVVDRVSISSVFDLFKPERIYDLNKWQR